MHGSRRRGRPRRRSGAMATDRSAASSEACSVVILPCVSRDQGSRARTCGAKATEGTWEPRAGAEGPPACGGVERSEGFRGNWRDPVGFRNSDQASDQRIWYSRAPGVRNRFPGVVEPSAPHAVPGGPLSCSVRRGSGASGSDGDIGTGGPHLATFVSWCYASWAGGEVAWSSRRR